jgi:DNA invertase Pin-like site-specific DNA recombinase
MWQMVGILAELERALIQERTKAGRAAAQARGVKMGRKPLLSAPQVAHARTLLAQGERLVHVARLLNVSRRTLERALRP